MGIYGRYVLPRLIDFACGMGDVMKQRSLLVPAPMGGCWRSVWATGLNLGFYDAAKVSAIVGVDPAAQMRTLAPRARGANRHPGGNGRPRAWRDPAPGESFDTIVCTFTLCSIAAPRRRWARMRRVLNAWRRIAVLRRARAGRLGAGHSNGARRPGGNRWPAVAIWTATCRPYGEAGFPSTSWNRATCPGRGR
ncbi:methyltransferase domain-containing protein [Pseudomonas aeruginosa]